MKLTLWDKVVLYEADLVEKALKRNNDNKKDAAAELGIDRDTVYKILKRADALRTQLGIVK
jgi:transcriptional regulator with PAS, ATPase and Fis domain